MVQLDKNDAIKNIDKYIEIVSNHFEEYGRDETFLKAEDYVLKHCDARNKYLFALKVPGIDVAKFQKSIIESGNAKYMYYLARKVAGVDIYEIVEAICNTGSAEYIYKAALRLSLNPSFKDVVINTLCLRLSKILKLRREHRDMIDDAICKTNDAEYIFRYAKDVRWANKKKIVNAIVELGNADAAYDVAYYVPNLKQSQISDLADVVLKSGRPDMIWLFVINVSNAPIDSMLEALCDLKSAEYIFYCLRTKFAANSYDIRSKLVEALCDSQNATYILEAAQNVRPTHLEPELKQMLADAMLECGDKDQLREFALRVHGVDKDEIKAKYNALDNKYKIEDEPSLENVLKELNSNNTANN